eukprot:tig00000093_g3576.t1
MATTQSIPAAAPARKAAAAAGAGASGRRLSWSGPALALVRSASVKVEAARPDKEPKTPTLSLLNAVERQQRRHRRASLALGSLGARAAAVRGGRPELLDELRGFYKAEGALLERESLRFAPRVVLWSVIFWRVIDSNNDNTLRRNEYLPWLEVLYRGLHEEWDAAKAAAACEQDWEMDRRGKPYVRGETFFLSVFQLADTWTEGIDAEEMDLFLEVVFAVVTRWDPARGSFALRPLHEVEPGECLRALEAARAAGRAGAAASGAACPGRAPPSAARSHGQLPDGAGSFRGHQQARTGARAAGAGAAGAGGGEGDRSPTSAASSEGSEWSLFWGMMRGGPGGGAQGGPDPASARRYTLHPVESKPPTEPTIAPDFYERLCSKLRASSLRRRASALTDDPASSTDGEASPRGPGPGSAPSSSSALLSSSPSLPAPNSGRASVSFRGASASAAAAAGARAGGEAGADYEMELALREVAALMPGAAGRLPRSRSRSSLRGNSPSPSASQARGLPRRLAHRRLAHRRLLLRGLAAGRRARRAPLGAPELRGAASASPSGALAAALALLERDSAAPAPASHPASPAAGSLTGLAAALSPGPGDLPTRPPNPAPRAPWARGPRPGASRSPPLVPAPAPAPLRPAGFASLRFSEAPAPPSPSGLSIGLGPGLRPPASAPPLAPAPGPALRRSLSPAPSAPGSFGLGAGGGGGFSSLASASESGRPAGAAGRLVALRAARLPAARPAQRLPAPALPPIALPPVPAAAATATALYLYPKFS